MNQKNKIGRRKFLGQLGGTGCLLLSSGLAPSLMGFPAEKNTHQFEARWYEKQAYKKVLCKLCPRECKIDDRERGYCGVRENWDAVFFGVFYFFGTCHAPFSDWSDYFEVGCQGADGDIEADLVVAFACAAVR